MNPPILLARDTCIGVCKMDKVKKVAGRLTAMINPGINGDVDNL